MIPVVAQMDLDEVKCSTNFNLCHLCNNATTTTTLTILIRSIFNFEMAHLVPILWYTNINTKRD